MSRNPNSGFALLVVIWGLGVISLLVVSFMTTGRLRLQAANNIAGAARAAAIVEGASNLVVMRLLRERDQRSAPQQAAVTTPQDPNNKPAYDGAPTFCAFGGAAVAVAIEDESGKIDLNAAAPEMISALIQGLGENRNRADAVAAAIVAFRTVAQEQQVGASQQRGSRPFAPKFGLFQTALELDQIEGVDPALFRRMAPLMTVYSRNAVVNARAAPPALFGAMAGMKPEEVNALIQTPFPNSLNRADPRFPQQFNGQTDTGAYLIRVEALLPNGQASGRETIVDFSGADFATSFGGASPGAYQIKEVRRAASRYGAQLQNAALYGSLRPC